MTDTDGDVVVIGGGLAGLAAGRQLRANGLDPVVLEARERVGGKTHSEQSDYGDPIEYGGQWVGADQERVLAYIDEYDIDTRPQYYAGDVVTRVDGRRAVASSYEETLRTLPDDVRTDLFEGFDAVAACVDEVPRTEPTAAPEAESWDAITLRTWADRQFETDLAQAVFERSIPGIYTAEPGEFSFLFFCYCARTCGGFDMISGLEGDADSHADVVVNVQSIAGSVAADLGDAVRLGEPARRVEHDESGVTVHTDSRRYRADDAVVALPPVLAGRLDYDPALPAARDQLTGRMPGGSVIKSLVRYPEPFWREAGVSGLAEDDAGPANYFFDDGFPDGETGRLVGFVCGANAHQWARRSPPERRAATLDQLVDLFEDDRFAEPIAYHERSWLDEPYSRGGYHCYPTPGTMTACWDAIREPVGRIHWASAETATRWYGHMDGAIRSGERAAREIQKRREEKKA
jgi:monoamine oxidase